MANNINNALTYIKWRGDLSFSASPFNEIDGYICSQLSFLNVKQQLNNEVLKIKDVYDLFFLENKDALNLGVIVPKTIIDLGKKVAKAPRYQNCYISDFEENFDTLKTEQFAAVTIHLDEETMVIAFQGTDDTLIGWEEDFEMVKNFPIYAQTSSLIYLDKIAGKFPNKKMYIVGHSKGGNLAMYSSIFTNVDNKNRIIQIYNYDGPGFEKKNIDLMPLTDIENKIITILPERSVIGMIFDQLGTIKVVRSHNRGLYQHDGFSWEVTRGHFTYVNDITNDCKLFSEKMDAIIAALSIEDRIRFCDSLDKYVKSLECKTLSELKDSKNKLKILTNMRVFTREDKNLCLSLIRIALEHKVVF